jgi:DNA sulfur modification protein DndE
MFSHIKTSKENKEVVTKLTNKLNLGAENVIARVALAYSLAQDEKLDLKDLKDSGGKEYSKSVLFGDQYDIYLGMICSKYNMYPSNKDVQKYLKLHLDNGLSRIFSQYMSDASFNVLTLMNNTWEN